MPDQVERFDAPRNRGGFEVMSSSLQGGWVRHSDYEKKPPEPGVMHPVDKAFSDLAVKERNHAWEESARHARERDEARRNLETLKSHLSSTGITDLSESLCEAAHNAWMKEKIDRGVTSWPNERGFEQLVTYDECPEDVKEFDRVVIRAIAKRLIEEITEI